MKVNLIKAKLFIFVSLLFFVSCQKEISEELGSGGGGGNNSNNIVGDWNFVGLSAKTYSSVSVNDNGTELKTITVSDYNTKNNTGTVKITSSQLIMNGISYSIDTTMNLKIYLNNVLFDDTDLPFVVNQPAYNATLPYTRNSNDSITVTGPLGVAANPSGAPPTGPSGLKIAWAGDTLLLKLNNSFTQSIVQGGIPATLNGSANGVMKLKKR